MFTSYYTGIGLLARIVKRLRLNTILSARILSLQSGMFHFEIEKSGSLLINVNQLISEVLESFKVVLPTREYNFTSINIGTIELRWQDLSVVDNLFEPNFLCSYCRRIIHCKEDYWLHVDTRGHLRAALSNGQDSYFRKWRAVFWYMVKTIWIYIHAYIIYIFRNKSVRYRTD